MKSILFSLVFLSSIYAWAEPGGGGITPSSNFVDGHYVGPRTADPGPDLSHLRMHSYREGNRLSHNINQIQTPSSESTYTPVIGADGAAYVGNSMYAFSQMKSVESPEFGQLEHKAKVIESETRALKEHHDRLDEERRLYNERMQAERERIDREIAENQRRLNTPVDEKLTAAANRMIERKSREAQTKLADQLRDYDTRELHEEIRDWNTYSKNKKDTLEQISKLSSEAERLRNSTTLNQTYQDIGKAAIQSSIYSLTEAAQIASGHREGNFAEALGVSQTTYEIGKAVADIGLSVTPGVGWAKDCYEALTGKSLLDGTELDAFGRGFAVLGVVTVGGTSIAKGAFKALSNLGHALHARSLGHGFESAIRVAESGITNVTRHTPITEGLLHTTPIKGVDLSANIPRSQLPMQTISDTFRSGTYIKYTTTEPMTLYRVASATPETAAAMKNLETTTAHWSGFWTKTPPTSPTQAMIDSALERSWGSHANVWVEIRIPAGTTLYEGVTASIQRIGHNMSDFVGGGNQIYHHGNIPKEWIQRVGDFL